MNDIILRGTAPTEHLGTYLMLEYEQWSTLWSVVVDAMYPECSGNDDCQHCDDQQFLSAYQFRGVHARAEEAVAFASAIEGRDRGAILVQHDMLTDRLMKRFLRFLRTCGGFEYSPEHS